jgi:hypothetical protein
MTRISKRLRDDAAYLCAVIASAEEEDTCRGVDSFADDLGFSSTVSDLALNATLSSYARYEHIECWRDSWAYAEAMLREFP